MIRQALESIAFHQTRAAEQQGISERILHYKIKKYKLKNYKATTNI